MRRKVEALIRSKGVGEDIRNHLNPDQLAGIGAITIAFNELEFVLDAILLSALDIPGRLWPHLITRINAIDAKIDIIKAAATMFNIDKATMDLIGHSFGEVANLKKHRDCVIHARVLGVPPGFGERIGYKAEGYEVILQPEALHGLCDRLTILSKELFEIMLLLSVLRETRDPAIFQSEELAKAAMAQVREYQQKRQRLLPLPQIPDGPLTF